MGDVEGLNKMCNINKGYYNNAVTAFFLRALDFISTLKEVYKTEEIVEIVFKGETQTFEKEESNIIEKILNFLLEFYTDSENELKIGNKKFVKQEKDIFYIMDNTIKDILILKQIKENLDNLFIEKEIVEHFNDVINRLINLYDSLSKSKGKNSIWGKEAINVFLNSYYDILSFCLCEEEVLKIEGIQENVLIPLLNLGVNWTDENPCVGMTSPIVLSALHLIYDRLEEYLDMEFIDGDMQEKICQEIFLSKIHQIFRFYLINPQNGNLSLAAIPAYQEEQNDKLEIPVKELSSCSSYQGIRELRLGEKILYELEKVIESNNIKDRYNIVLAGDVSKSPLIELIYYVDKIRTTDENYSDVKEVKLYYFVYTRNYVRKCDTEESKYGNSVYVFKENTDLFSGVSSLENVLNSGDFFFFLDNCALYLQEVKEIENQIVFKQSISSETYQQHYCGVKIHDMILNCKFIDLYNSLVTYVLYGRLGFLKKRAKENIIKYIHDYINNNDEKIVYIYISDIDAFKSLGCVQEHIVRIEQYNQKEIGIIRLYKGRPEALPVSYKYDDEKREHILVFNIWQFVKHNAINKRDYFETVFFKKQEKNIYLNNIYIGINYSDWRNEIIVDWCACKTVKNAETGHMEIKKVDIEKTEVEKFINYILIELIEKKDKNMYYHYMNKAFISFIYGATKSVEDLVFLHILNKKRGYIRKIRMGKENLDIKKYYSKNCKYSYKKIYWSAIEKFDQETPSLTDSYTALEDVKENKNYVNSIKTPNVVGKFLEDIISACRQINYSDSYLYDNCIYKLKKI